MRRFRRFLAGMAVLAAASPSGTLAAAVSAAVKVDQVGYLASEAKLAMLTAAPTGSVNVRRVADGVSVLTVAAGPGAVDAASGDTVRTVDFSAVTTPGAYYLDVPGLGQSYPFTISPWVYQATWRTAMRGYYVQRCGTAVDMAPDFPAYYHFACHESDANFDASSGKAGSKAATKGWHDAGDFGKYIINANISVGELLWAWERYGPSVASANLAIPETGNGTPDMLNEIKWELDWMLTMQDGDGGVWEKLTSDGFGSFTLPENDDASMPRVIIGGRTAAPWKDSGSTGGFAAVMAIAARAYQPYNPAYAATCLAAAKSAYTWVKANPNVGCANPSYVSTGDYCGTNATACRLWAAAELLRSTGLAGYATDFEASKGAAPYVSGVQDWTDVNNLAMWAYAQASGAVPSTVARIEADTVADANGLTATAAANGYRNTLNTGNYYWGSNGEAGNMSLLLLMANQFAPQAAYVQSAVDNVHYLLGRNCFTTSWVTQVGSSPELHPHHRPSGSPEYVNLPPWPGLLSGGPNSGGGDPITDAIPGSVPPMRHWTDQTMAYSCNEVAINWQAPLVFTLAALIPTPGGAASPTPSPSPSPTPLAAFTPVRIDCGNSTGPYVDSLGATWSMDQFFSNSTASTVGNAIAGTADPALYQTGRYNSTFRYGIPVPPGNYEVILKFAETYWTGAGDRVFNVSINGNPALTGFDIYAAAGGAFKAVDETFTNVTPSLSNLITISFGPASADNPTVNAIEVLAMPSPTPSPSPTRSPTPSATSSASPTATASSTPTPSVSPSATQTPTATRSASPSPSGTTTAGPSAVVTATPSASPSPALSPTVSATVSPTPSASSTPSPGATPEPSPSATGTPSPGTTTSASPSATASATAAASASPSATPSAGPSATPSASPNPSLSSSPSPSPTLAPSQTSSPSPSPVATSTPSQTPAPSQPPSPTPSPGASAHPSATPSPSPSPSPTPSFGAAPILSQAGTAGPGQNAIAAARPVPNPDPSSLAVLLEGDVDRVELRVYGVSMACLGRADSGPQRQGWAWVPLPAAFAAAAAPGCYFYRVLSYRSGQACAKPMVGTFMVIR